ncbi:hypothetical protein PEBR_18795 [Penicillium brasilianum]|uniref:Uncharacterized protein n=1 Tax=Penicillium brasilianum TaxID=104259 RepID=A0A1S9RP24_PENBI|nr:hypothetical protein PEBR_18795 [Penicillium brasilianum]
MSLTPSRTTTKQNTQTVTLKIQPPFLVQEAETGPSEERSPNHSPVNRPPDHAKTIQGQGETGSPLEGSQKLLQGIQPNPPTKDTLNPSKAKGRAGNDIPQPHPRTKGSAQTKTKRPALAPAATANPQCLAWVLCRDKRSDHEGNLSMQPCLENRRGPSAKIIKCNCRDWMQFLQDVVRPPCAWSEHDLGMGL